MNVPKDESGRRLSKSSQKHKSGLFGFFKKNTANTDDVQDEPLNSYDNTDDEPEVYTLIPTFIPENVSRPKVTSTIPTSIKNPREVDEEKFVIENGSILESENTTMTESSNKFSAFDFSDGDIFEQEIEEQVSKASVGEPDISFSPTQKIDLSLDDDIKTVSQWMTYFDSRLLFSKNHRNKIFENDILKLEEDLKSLTEAYQHGVEHYDDMKFEKSLLELQSEDEFGRSSNNDDIRMVSQQNNSNIQFFELSDLEETRYYLNDLRRKILQDMLDLLSKYSSSIDSSELVFKIYEKIEAIAQVKNRAYSASVSPTTSPDSKRSIREVKLSEVESYRQYAKDYYTYAEKIGFDPIYIYRDELVPRYLDVDYIIVPEDDEGGGEKDGF